MYVHPAFNISREDALAFARKRGFGVACACNRGRPVGVHVPFLVNGNGGRGTTLEFHVSRANPIAQCADGMLDWTMMVLGADAYVSPGWYASSDQVPTWLYEAVHLSGPVRRMSAEEAARHSDALSTVFETKYERAPPWTSDKMSPQRRDAMRRGIIGLVMEVIAVEGQRKLNQHKRNEDHVAIAEALASRVDDPGSRAIASAMRDLKPDLAYAAPAMDGRTPEPAQQEEP